MTPDGVNQIITKYVVGYQRAKPGYTLTVACELARDIIAFLLTPLAGGVERLMIIYRAELYVVSEETMMPTGGRTVAEGNVDGYHLIAVGGDTKVITNFVLLRDYVRTWFTCRDQQPIGWYEKPVPFKPTLSASASPDPLAALSEIDSLLSPQPIPATLTTVSLKEFEVFLYLPSNRKKMGWFARRRCLKQARDQSGKDNQLPVAAVENLLGVSLKKEFRTYCENLAKSSFI